MRRSAGQRHGDARIDVESPERRNQRQQSETGHEHAVHQAEQRSQDKAERRQQERRGACLQDEHREDARERNHSADRDVDACAAAQNDQGLAKRRERENRRELQYGGHRRESERGRLQHGET